MANQRDSKGSADIPSGDKVHGEGNYEASKQYNEATKRFVDSGKVDEAAKAARPKDEKEASDLRKAEETGKARAKEEDPALSPTQQPDGEKTRKG